MKAKRQQEEIIESRKKLAEIKLSQLEKAEENRQANQKVVLEKAKYCIEKVRIFIENFLHCDAPKSKKH